MRVRVRLLVLPIVVHEETCDEANAFDVLADALATIAKIENPERAILNGGPVLDDAGNEVTWTVDEVDGEEQT